MVAHRSFESSRRACCTSWGLMEMLRIAKVWQEFPQRYARARARLVGFCRSGFLCRRAVASEATASLRSGGSSAHCSNAPCWADKNRPWQRAASRAPRSPRPRTDGEFAPGRHRCRGSAITSPARLSRRRPRQAGHSRASSVTHRGWVKKSIRAALLACFARQRLADSLLSRLAPVRGLVTARQTFAL